MRVDYLPGGEARIAAEAPACLYAAFLHDRTAQLGRGGGRNDGAGADQDPLPAWLRREATRVRDQDPVGWTSGEALIRDLELET